MRDLVAVASPLADVLMTQLATCRRAVGIALLAAPELHDLRGRGPDLDAMALALTGVSPRPGEHVVAPWGWWIRTSPHRAGALADVTSGPGLRRALAGAGDTSADVAASDGSPACAVLVLAGPHAGRVLAAATALLPRPVVAVADGDDYRVLLVPADTALTVHRSLLAVGRDDGALAVGPKAVATLRAADRVMARQRPSHGLRLVDDLIRPGAPGP